MKLMAKWKSDIINDDLKQIEEFVKSIRITMGEPIGSVELVVDESTVEYVKTCCEIIESHLKCIRSLM